MLHATTPGNIKIVREFDKTGGFIQANQNRFEDSITNLILNAVDALKDRENGKITVYLNFGPLPKGMVKVSAKPISDKYCHIKISDNGHGMTSETKERLFEPFYTTKQQGKGTGLGLSQVYGFIQAHNGLINVQSELSEGTQFNLYLPTSLFVSSEKTSYQSNELTTGTESILIVDDEPEIAKLIKQFLDNLGYQTFIADNAEGALACVENHKVDALITDVMMPDINGYQLVRLIREKIPELPVVFVSGYSVAELGTRYEDVQENSLRLEKPFRQSDLVKALREVLKRNN